MQVRAAVIECGEQEGCIRHTYHPVADTVLEGIFHSVIAQSRLGQIHGADAGKDIVIDFVGSVLHFDAVSGTTRYIVGIVDQQDQIIAHIFIRLDDTVIELLKQCIVQPAVSQTQQEFLRAALRFTL